MSGFSQSERNLFRNLAAALDAEMAADAAERLAKYGPRVVVERGTEPVAKPVTKQIELCPSCDGPMPNCRCR